MARKRVDKLPLWLFGIILASSYYLLTSTKPKPLSGFGDDEHLGYDPLGIGEVDLGNVSDGVPGGGLGQYSLTPVYGGFQSFRVSPVKAITPGALSEQSSSVVTRQAPRVPLPLTVLGPTFADIAAHAILQHDASTHLINAVNTGTTLSPTSATSSVTGGSGIISSVGGGLRAFMQNLLARRGIHGWSVNGW